VKIVERITFEATKKGGSATVDIYDDGSYHVRHVMDCNVMQEATHTVPGSTNGFDGAQIGAALHVD
jgi:hypothetical protein